MISGWQESYLAYSNYLSDGCGLGDTPTPDPGGAVGYEHGWPNHGPPKVFSAGGCAPKDTSDGGVGARGVRGVNAIGARYVGATGAGGTGDTGTCWEQLHHFIGSARSGVANC
jgi:hypothetical protein